VFADDTEFAIPESPKTRISHKPTNRKRLPERLADRFNFLRSQLGMLSAKAIKWRWRHCQTNE